MANDPRWVSFTDCSKGIEDYACRLKMQEEAEAVGKIRPEDLSSTPETWQSAYSEEGFRHFCKEMFGEKGWSAGAFAFGYLDKADGKKDGVFDVDLTPKDKIKEVFDRIRSPDDEETGILKKLPEQLGIYKKHYLKKYYVVKEKEQFVGVEEESGRMVGFAGDGVRETLEGARERNPGRKVVIVTVDRQNVSDKRADELNPARVGLWSSVQFKSDLVVTGGLGVHVGATIDVLPYDTRLELAGYGPGLVGRMLEAVDTVLETVDTTLMVATIALAAIGIARGRRGAGGPMPEHVQVGFMPAYAGAGGGNISAAAVGSPPTTALSPANERAIQEAMAKARVNGGGGMVRVLMAEGDGKEGATTTRLHKTVGAKKTGSDEIGTATGELVAEAKATTGEPVAGIKTPPVTAPSPGTAAAEPPTGQPATTGLPPETVRDIGEEVIRVPETKGGGNMPKKVGMFEKAMSRELNEMIDRQLSLQVNVLFARHHDFLVQHGLTKCNAVLDVGTGNGDFCCRLAERYPKIKFTGIDSKSEMIERAIQLSNDREITNTSWVIGDISTHQLGRVESSFDGILLRYADIHMPHIESTLGLLRTTLRPGGRIWIISVDLDHMYCKPPHEAFDLYKRGTERLYKTHGMDPHIGAKIPTMLRKAGYDSIIVEPYPMSPQDIGVKEYQEYMLNEAILFHHFDPTSLSCSDLKKIKNFVEQVVPSPDYYGTYGDVLIAAEK